VFFNSLIVYQHRLSPRAEAMAAIQEYIEIFHNRMRRHSALGSLRLRRNILFTKEICLSHPCPLLTVQFFMSGVPDTLRR